MSPMKLMIDKSMILIPGKYVAVILNTSLQVNVITNQLRITTNPIQERAVECSLGSTNIIHLIPDIGNGNAIDSTVKPKRQWILFDKDKTIATNEEITLI